ncbi:MAG: hypothetical protein CI947_866, partial [Halanaerobium sp.]
MCIRDSIVWTSEVKDVKIYSNGSKKEISGEFN